MCQICDMTRCPITCPNYEDRQEDVKTEPSAKELLAEWRKARGKNDT